MKSMTPLSKQILNPECVRIHGVLPPKIYFEIFGVRSVFSKNADFHLFHLIASRKKNSSVYCVLIIDATDHPHSLFQALYHKLFRGAPRVDQMPPVWPTGPPKVRNHRFLAAKTGLFWGCFWTKSIFLAMWLT